MAEIIDFIIELIASLNGAGRNFMKAYNLCENIPADDRNQLIERLNDHFSHNSDIVEMVHVIVKRNRCRLKMIVLDAQYNRITTVLMKDTLVSDWKNGRIDIGGYDVFNK